MKRWLVVGIMLMCFFFIGAEAEDNSLYIAKNGWKEGIINTDGDWIVEPIYSRIWPYTSAGYAVVETEPAPLYSPFKLLDKQGNIVADLPDWHIDYSETQLGDYEPEMAGNMFILDPMTEDRCSILYFADTGRSIELDSSFLGYELYEEEDELTAKQEDKYPSSYSLYEWNDRVILEWWYYHPSFVILDRNGNKVKEEIYVGYIEDIYEDEQSNSSYLLMREYNKSDEELWKIIDMDGNILSTKLSRHSYWRNDLKALYYYQKKEIEILPDGEKMSEFEFTKRKASQTPCGLAMWHTGYIDSQGNNVPWADEDKGIISATEFNSDGVAWVYKHYEDLCLVNAKGDMIVENVIPEYNYEIDNWITPSMDCWESVSSDEKGCDYIKASGEMLFGNYPLDRAYTFENGLAEIGILDAQYKLVSAYINLEGKVVWAEDGRKEEIQQMLDEGKRYSVSNMTIEKARQALVGEWYSSYDESEHVIAFYNDGTYSDKYEELQHWDILMNMDQDEETMDSSPFVLELSTEGNNTTSSMRYKLRFYNVDEYRMDLGDEYTYFDRVEPGYLERFKMMR